MILQGARILRFPAVNLPGVWPSRKADVKPKCEWLKGKLAQREANRAAESQSLKDAVKLLKDWVTCGRLEAPKTWRLKRLQGSKRRIDWLLFFFGKICWWIFGRCLNFQRFVE